MKRRNFFKSIGVAGLLPIIPKEKLYTKNEALDIFATSDEYFYIFFGVDENYISGFEYISNGLYRKIS
jgi:hypothetical protein